MEQVLFRPLLLRWAPPGSMLEMQNLSPTWTYWIRTESPVCALKFEKHDLYHKCWEVLIDSGQGSSLREVVWLAGIPKWVSNRSGIRIWAFWVLVIFSSHHPMMSPHLGGSMSSLLGNVVRIYHPSSLLRVQEDTMNYLGQEVQRATGGHSIYLMFFSALQSPLMCVN